MEYTLANSANNIIPLELQRENKSARFYEARKVNSRNAFFFRLFFFFNKSAISPRANSRSHEIPVIRARENTQLIPVILFPDVQHGRPSWRIVRMCHGTALWS